MTDKVTMLQCIEIPLTDLIAQYLVPKGIDFTDIERVEYDQPNQVIRFCVKEVEVKAGTVQKPV